MRGYSIGALARATGTRVANIRFYESISLIPPAARQPGGQRQFDESDVRRLNFIRTCRTLDFPLEQIRALLRLSDPGNLSCTSAKELASDQLVAIRSRIAELLEIEARLVETIKACDARCGCARAPACGLLMDPR